MVVIQTDQCAWPSHLSFKRKHLLNLPAFVFVFGLPTMIYGVRQFSLEVSRAAARVGTCPCVVPKGQYWLSVKGRFLRPVEALALQGWGPEEIKLTGGTATSDATQRSLAGNAVSGTVFGAVFLGALLQIRR